MYVDLQHLLTHNKSKCEVFESELTQKARATMLASMNSAVEWCVWVAVLGVVHCAQALGAPVAGWARASAGRLTSAIPVEFGLYSCI